VDLCNAVRLSGGPLSEGGVRSGLRWISAKPARKYVQKHEPLVHPMKDSPPCFRWRCLRKRLKVEEYEAETTL